MSHSMFKTDEIKTLRISSYLNFVCNRAGIELTGYQFERYFEPEKVIRDEATKAVKRSCKYDRYIYKSVCPNHDTAMLIESKTSGSIELLYSPIWRVLDCIVSGNELNSSIEELHLVVQQELLKSKRDSTNHYVRKSISTTSLENLMKAGDLHGLCGLLILLFGTDRTLLKPSRLSVEKRLFEMLVNIAAAEYPTEVIWNIYQCYFPYLPRRTSRKELTFDEFKFKVAQKNKLLTLATNKGHIMFFEERCRFLNLMFSGDCQLIKRELKLPGNALINRGEKVRNMFWLVKRLNTLRPYGDRRRFIYN